LHRNRYVVLAVVFLAMAAIGRIVLTYRVTSQAFDEPCHVAAGMELLDKHTYQLDPVHPPLTRVAIGLPLYLAGERFPKWSPDDPHLQNYNDVGNSVLFDSGHYLRNLVLARIAMLPFFALTVALVFLWTRREFGNFAGIIAAAIFTTLPIVLAFSSLAYTDLPTACLQFAALFAFTTWLQNPTARSTWLLGVVVGLAALSKLTSLLFVPASAAAIFLCWWIFQYRREPAPRAANTRRLAKLLAAGALVVVVVWGGYGFSVGHVRESMQLSPESMPSFQHFPGPLRGLARRVVLRDSLVPAPALLRGAAMAWSLNKAAPPAYLLGHIKNGGWWYFFLVGVAVKTPLPVLFLCLVGIVALLTRLPRWSALAPVASVAAILIVTMPVKYNAGVRHVLVVFPFLAMIAGCGSAYLWHQTGKRRFLGRFALAVLLVWQAASSLSAGSDYITYFNPLAGRDPSLVMVAGCDLDCGQDIFRLAQALRTRHTEHLSIAAWSSADMSRMGLPSFDVPPPFQPVSGWFAISRRAQRFGDVFHKTYPPGAFAWLDRYQPVERVGKTILLYNIPGQTSVAERKARSGDSLP